MFPPSSRNTKLDGLPFETRAKGGAMLLNVGPTPNGELPIEEEGRLRNVGPGRSFNGECNRDTFTGIVANEEDIWFSRIKDTTPEDASLNAILTGGGDWAHGREYLSFTEVLHNEQPARTPPAKRPTPRRILITDISKLRTA